MHKSLFLMPLFLACDGAPDVSDSTHEATVRAPRVELSLANEMTNVPPRAGLSARQEQQCLRMNDTPLQLGKKLERLGAGENHIIVGHEPTEETLSAVGRHQLRAAVGYFFPDADVDALSMEQLFTLAKPTFYVVVDRNTGNLYDGILVFPDDAFFAELVFAHGTLRPVSVAEDFLRHCDPKEFGPKTGPAIDAEPDEAVR